MKTMLIDRMPRIEGLLKVIVSETETERKIFLESGRPLHLEKQLIGSYPLEAAQTVQNLSASSGIAHGLSAVAALEHYLQIQPTQAAFEIRQIMLQLSTLRAHIIHFYFEWLPDYLNQDHFVSPETLAPFLRMDYRPEEKREGDLSSDAGREIASHVRAASAALNVLQQCQTLLSGKFPIAMNLIPGGISNFEIDRSLLMQLARNLESIKPFVEVIWPADVKRFIQDLPEMVAVPVKNVNMISYGSLTNGNQADTDAFYADGVLTEGKLEPINNLLITESLASTFYIPETEKTDSGQPDYDFEKRDATTWIKGARYDGEPMLTGALSRMMITHFGGSNLEISDRVGRMIDDLGLGMDSPSCAASRLLAEVFEGRFYMKSTLRLLLDFESGRPLNRKMKMDFSKTGTGISRIEAPAGALLHQVYITEGRISQYRIVAAANWNFSSADANGRRGIAENELNTLLEKPTLTALQVQRVIHSYNAQIVDGTQ